MKEHERKWLESHERTMRLTIKKVNWLLNDIQEFLRDGPILCKNCQHYRDGKCAEEKVMDMITGEYAMQDCEEARASGNPTKCGENGIWYERRIK